MKQVTLLLLFFFACVCSQAQMVKKISIDDLDNYIRNSNKPMVVNFWASFCKPCIEEIPYFLESAAKNDSVEMVLVSLDLPDFYPAKVESFLKKRNFIGATQFWLNETNADDFCPRIDPSWQGAMPVTLFVNNNRAYRRFVGRPMTQLQVIEAFELLTK